MAEGNLLQRYLDAAAGLGELTRQSAERLVEQARSAGLPVPEDAIDDLLERRRRTTDMLSAVVGAEVQRALRSAGVASDEDVLRLQEEVLGLRRRVLELERARQDVAEDRGGAS